MQKNPLDHRRRTAGLCLMLVLLTGCAAGTAHPDTPPPNDMSMDERPPGERTAEKAFALLREADSMRLSFTSGRPGAMP